MNAMRIFSNTDLLVLAVVVGVVCYILGLLSDVLMGDRGFGPARNAIIIVAGGIAGTFAMLDLHPPAPRTELISSAIWGLGTATVALLIGSLVKKIFSH